MVVGDCLRVDKNDTALSGLIFLNKVVARKFLPLSNNFSFRQEHLLLFTINRLLSKFPNSIYCNILGKLTKPKKSRFS